MKYFGLAFCILLFSGMLYAQPFLIKGTITDAVTAQALPFATIGIPSKGIGVVSNEYGFFILNTGTAKPTDTITISFIGYSPTKRVLSSFLSKAEWSIALQPKTIALNEVSVSKKLKIKPEQIVKKAIEHIKDNYPQTRFQICGYYRDYFKEEDEYKNLVEAALIIDDKGFNTNDFTSTDIKIEQMRLNQTYQIETDVFDENKFISPLSIKIADLSELNFLRHKDLIRNHKNRTVSYLGRFTYDFIPKHKFKFERITNFDTINLIVISFEADHFVDDIKGERFYLSKGEIFIDNITFAIYRFTYNVSVKSKLLTDQIFGLTIEYKPVNKQMYLNYISANNYFEYKTGTKAHHCIQYREFFVNKVLTSPTIKFYPEEIIDKTRPLYENKNKIPTNDTFWDTYNYLDIKPLLKQ